MRQAIVFSDIIRMHLMIETNDLSKQFNDFQAVDGVDLSVQSGQILALLGQNGAGKTTTVRMLTALASTLPRLGACGGI
jgi:ABC-type multidrug transport system ATPase subunit